MGEGWGGEDKGGERGRGGWRRAEGYGGAKDKEECVGVSAGRKGWEGRGGLWGDGEETINRGGGRGEGGIIPHLL